MMNPIKHPAPLGEISSGTHRLADLVPRFAEVLENLARKNGVIDRHVDLLSRAKWTYQVLARLGLMDWDNEDAVATYDELVEALDDFSPRYSHFGARYDDFASFGFWLDDIECIKADVTDLMKGMVVSDLSEVPKRFNGEVLLINNHGNVSLYVSARGKLHCIWSVV